MQGIDANADTQRPESQASGRLENAARAPKLQYLVRALLTGAVVAYVALVLPRVDVGALGIGRIPHAGRLLLVLAYVVIRYLIEGTPQPGFPFLASIIAIFSGVQLFCLGIIGEYLARIHLRSMEKPPYVTRPAPIPSTDEAGGKGGAE